MEGYEKYKEIDVNGLVMSITYVVLFANDQAYNYTMQLKEDLKKCGLYKHGAKKLMNEIERKINNYNTNIFRVTNGKEEAFAEILLSMEEDVLPSINKYNDTISEVLRNNGLSGNANRISSLAHTLNMLVQMSSIAIGYLGEKIKMVDPSKNNPIDYLSIGKIDYLSVRLSSEVAGKGITIELNQQPAIMKAFNDITKALLRPDVLEKAFDRAG